MRYLEVDGSINKYVSQTIAVKEAPGSYFGFEKFPTGSAARDAFQIKGPATGSSWSDARLRGEFDTLQLYDPLTGRFNTRVPFEAGDTGSLLEPYTRYYPEFGSVMCNSLKLIKCSSSIRLIFCRRNDMTKEESVNILKYLLAKYLDDEIYILSTYKKIDEISDRPPVKGIMYDILRLKTRDFSSFDKDLVADLEYYFG
ncbi:hypothetical protein [Agrobacterium rosae]|uniref:Uncharacterized protein n=1 Tax=Agrobacterium rosae TaxID=1972867 RepID=A0AAW9FSC8_9HYPH|nr:hypothetical protein [Agrobacterium rosae]MDX8305703.1 hypothetical protein [Agrobacterium rosae]